MDLQATLDDKNSPLAIRAVAKLLQLAPIMGTQEEELRQFRIWLEEELK